MTNRDIYSCFADLAANEAAEHFSIELADRGAPTSIVAPHGGLIEPGTSELAQLTAGNDHNLYSFIGCKPVNSPDLHITSHRFDEPRCLALLKRSEYIITLHGFKSDVPQIYLGGLDIKLRQRLLNCFQLAGLPAADDHPKYQGKNPLNICNHSQRGMGVQIELSRHLRNCPRSRQQIAHLIRGVLADWPATG